MAKLTLKVKKVAQKNSATLGWATDKDKGDTEPESDSGNAPTPQPGGEVLEG